MTSEVHGSAEVPRRMRCSELTQLRNVLLPFAPSDLSAHGYAHYTKGLFTRRCVKC